jgi:hypothetical protein
MTRQTYEEEDDARRLKHIEQMLEQIMERSPAAPPPATPDKAPEPEIAIPGNWGKHKPKK